MHHVINLGAFPAVQQRSFRRFVNYILCYFIDVCIMLENCNWHWSHKALRCIHSPLMCVCVWFFFFVPFKVPSVSLPFTKFHTYTSRFDAAFLLQFSSSFKSTPRCFIKEAIQKQKDFVNNFNVCACLFFVHANYVL